MAVELKRVIIDALGVSCGIDRRSMMYLLLAVPRSPSTQVQRIALLRRSVVRTAVISTFLHCPAMSVRTLHGLLSSKPSGAIGLSVCPRMKPVNRRSRSITGYRKYRMR
jgi:hypothetical protein